MFRVPANLSLIVLFVCALTPCLSQAQTEEQLQKALAIEFPNDPAAVVAMVGSSPIFVGDLSPQVEARIKEVLSKHPGPVPEKQLQIARINLMRSALVQAVRNKMMRESFLLDQVGTEAIDKLKEVAGQMDSRTRQFFFENELPELKKEYGTEDMAELNKKLLEKGTSLANRQRQFTDNMLSQLYMRDKITHNPNITLAEINDYYQTHLSEFSFPHRARWEQLSVLFSRTSSREEAQKLIWEMGREAYFGGNLQAVAKAKSQEPFASEGGLHDWTEQGALASAELDKQIFSIPTNAMSEIIEDQQGLHIIRVLERQEAGVQPIGDVQEEIKEKLKTQKVVESQSKVLEEMHDRIPVWTLLPDDIPGSKPLPESIVNRNRTSLNR